MYGEARRSSPPPGDHDVDVAEARREGEVFGDRLQVADQHDLVDALRDEEVDLGLHGGEHLADDDAPGRRDRAQRLGRRADDADALCADGDHGALGEAARGHVRLQRRLGAEVEVRAQVLDAGELSDECTEDVGAEIEVVISEADGVVFERLERDRVEEAARGIAGLEVRTGEEVVARGHEDRAVGLCPSSRPRGVDDGLEAVDSTVARERAGARVQQRGLAVVVVQDRQAKDARPHDDSVLSVLSVLTFRACRALGPRGSCGALHTCGPLSTRRPLHAGRTVLACGARRARGALGPGGALSAVDAVRAAAREHEEQRRYSKAISKSTVEALRFLHARRDISPARPKQRDRSDFMATVQRLSVAIQRSRRPAARARPRRPRTRREVNPWVLARGSRRPCVLRLDAVRRPAPLVDRARPSAGASPGALPELVEEGDALRHVGVGLHPFVARSGSHQV